MLIELLKDPSAIKRDTAATGTIDRICEAVPEVILNGNILQAVLEIL